MKAAIVNLELIGDAAPVGANPRTSSVTHTFRRSKRWNNPTNCLILAALNSAFAEAAAWVEVRRRRRQTRWCQITAPRLAFIAVKMAATLLHHRPRWFWRGNKHLPLQRSGSISRFRLTQQQWRRRFLVARTGKARGWSWLVRMRNHFTHVSRRGAGAATRSSSGTAAPVGGRSPILVPATDRRRGKPCSSVIRRGIWAP